MKPITPHMFIYTMLKQAESVMAPQKPWYIMILGSPTYQPITTNRGVPGADGWETSNIAASAMNTLN